MVGFIEPEFELLRPKHSGLVAVAYQMRMEEDVARSTEVGRVPLPLNTTISENCRRVITLGRSQDKDIFFDDKYVSRHHGTMYAQNGNEVQVFYTDHSSTGSFLDGERLFSEAVRLSLHDVVELGLILNDDERYHGEVLVTLDHVEKMCPALLDRKMFPPKGYRADYDQRPPVFYREFRKPDAPSIVREFRIRIEKEEPDSSES